MGWFIIIKKKTFIWQLRFACLDAWKQMVPQMVGVFHGDDYYYVESGKHHQLNKSKSWEFKG